MKYITGAPRNEETEIEGEATFTALVANSQITLDWFKGKYSLKP